jgi:hypothetical protein
MAVARKIDAFNAAVAGAKLVQDLCVNKTDKNPLINPSLTNIIAHALQVSKICTPVGFALVEVYNLVSSYPRNYIRTVIAKDPNLTSNSLIYNLLNLDPKNLMSLIQYNGKPLDGQVLLQLFVTRDFSNLQICLESNDKALDGIFEASQTSFKTMVTVRRCANKFLSNVKKRRQEKVNEPGTAITSSLSGANVTLPLSTSIHPNRGSAGFPSQSGSDNSPQPINGHVAPTQTSIEDFKEKLLKEFGFLQQALGNEKASFLENKSTYVAKSLLAIPSDSRAAAFKSLAKLALCAFSSPLLGKNNFFDRYGLALYFLIEVVPSNLLLQSPTKMAKKLLKDASSGIDRIEKFEAIELSQIDNQTWKHRINLVGHLAISALAGNIPYLNTLLHFSWELTPGAIDVYAPEELKRGNPWLALLTGDPSPTSTKSKGDTVSGPSSRRKSRSKGGGAGSSSSSSSASNNYTTYSRRNSHSPSEDEGETGVDMMRVESVDSRERRRSHFPQSNQQDLSFHAQFPEYYSSEDEGEPRVQRFSGDQGKPQLIYSTKPLVNSDSDKEDSDNS